MRVLAPAQVVVAARVVAEDWGRALAVAQERAQAQAQGPAPDLAAVAAVRADAVPEEQVAVQERGQVPATGWASVAIRAGAVSVPVSAVRAGAVAGVRVAQAAARGLVAEWA